MVLLALDFYLYLLGYLQIKIRLTSIEPKFFRLHGKEMKYIFYIFSMILFIQGVLLICGISFYGARQKLEPNIENISFCFIFSIICFVFARNKKNIEFFEIISGINNENKN
jgi:hypothetical protein